MHLKSLIAVALASAILLGCGKKNDENITAPATEQPSGMLADAAKQAAGDAKVAALPKPDMKKPLTDYPEVDSGQQLMFLYVTASQLPPDFPKLAEAFSSEYRSTNDTFRKNDLLKALQPQLEQKIAAAKALPYGWFGVDDYQVLGSYDFTRKGFSVAAFEKGNYRYFNDVSSYKITWANHDELAFAPVADETVARELEAMRNSSNNRPQLKIYFFAQSADMNYQAVSAYVTRVQITDKSGRVLFEYGPNAK